MKLPSQNAKFTKYDECAVPQEHTYQSHAQACFAHVCLLDKSSGVGDGVWGGGDGKRHGARCSHSDAYQDGGCATDGIKSSPHSCAYYRKDRNEQGCCGSIGNKVAQCEAHEA